MSDVTVPREHVEQAAFVMEVKLKYRLDETFKPELFGSVPNGAYLGGENVKQRSAQMAKLKAEGLNPGMCDIIYLQPRGGYPYCAIEMKRMNASKHKNHDLGEDQIAFKMAALAAGAFYATAFGADDAIRVFDAYLALPPQKPTNNGDMTDYVKKVLKER